jgi:hypothetical protein
MNSIFENLNAESSVSFEARVTRCSECGWVGSHNNYPVCSKRVN